MMTRRSRIRRSQITGAGEGSEAKRVSSTRKRSASPRRTTMSCRDSTIVVRIEAGTVPRRRRPLLLQPRGLAGAVRGGSGRGWPEAGRPGQMQATDDDERIEAARTTLLAESRRRHQEHPGPRQGTALPRVAEEPGHDHVPPPRRGDQDGAGALGPDLPGTVTGTETPAQ